jgi:hypothetical protein
VLGGMAMILASVALIRAGGVRPQQGDEWGKRIAHRETYQTDGAGRHAEEAGKVRPQSQP